jgi:hypothetical protein
MYAFPRGSRESYADVDATEYVKEMRSKSRVLND